MPRKVPAEVSKPDRAERPDVALYSVKFYEISGLVRSGFETASAAAAKRIALDAFKSGAAKLVEVCDPSGSVILVLPEPDHRAVGNWTD